MTAVVVLALLLAAAIAVPHALPLQRVAPVSAVAVWFLALCLRALAACAAAIYLLVYVPQTHAFASVSDWCLRVVFPVPAVRLHLSGIAVADVASSLPAVALVGSLVAAAFVLVRATLDARGLLKRLAIGDGPLGSTVLDSDGILVAVTRTGPARLLISGAALTAFDDEELDAGLQHELGHLRRSHRPVMLAASLMRALARWQPGANAAYRELCFSLERDADEYALERTRNPLALASAICKAAAGQAAAIPVLGLQGRSRVTLRLDYLMAGGRQRGGVVLEQATRLLAVAMLALTLFLVIAGPAWAVTHGIPLPLESAAHHC